MVLSVYYGLMGAGGLHLISLAISLWLAWMFRQISLMPPDMNPLETNLTSRAMHKRNKSSVVTTSTYSDNEKRFDDQLYDDASRPPSVPFMHTRQNSETSFTSRDSRLNLPSRQYQITPGNRSSVTSQDLKRMSAPPLSSARASYMEIPLGETGAKISRPASMYSEGRPSSGSVPSYRAEQVPAAQTAQPRSAKFTETWYASESLINRTQQRTRAMNQSNSPPKRGNYTSLRHQSLDPANSDSDSDNEDDNHYGYRATSPTKENHDPNDDLATTSDKHPNPLRSNPTTSPQPSPSRRPRTPFSRLRASILSEVSLNGDSRRQQRLASGSQDITDTLHHTENTSNWTPRNRNSSIQPDAAFSLGSYSKRYGDLKPGTPPIMVGGSNTNRQVSSGNDVYDLGSGGVMGRRHVSGKVAEEGRAGEGWMY